MVYDPSAKSRSASGVFPRGFPFTNTSASAGVDRISTLPVCAPRTAPDAGREGEGLGALRVLGAIGAFGALRALLRAAMLGVSGSESGLPAVAPTESGAEAGRSTTVASTPASWPVAGVGRGDRRKNPTDNAVRTAKTRKAATIVQRLVGSNSISVCNSRGCASHDPLGRDAGDDGVMTGSMGSSGKAMRSTGLPTRRSKSPSDPVGALGTLGALGVF